MTHIDTAARAMAQCDRERNPTWGGEDSWDELPEYKRLDYVYMARVAIESLRLNDFEDWVREDIDKCVAELQRIDGLGDPRYTAGRLVAFRDVLNWLGVDQ